MPINKEYVPIDNQPTIKPRTVTGIFTRYIAKTLPLAFDESMSYYECLCALLEYINTKVIPALDNNAAGLLELQEFYEELQTYVNDYFKNLDVQEEINNKLDEMAESGQLTDIIAQYLGLAGMIAFDSVADMKQATNLVNGSKCETLGYRTVNDSGNATYKVRTVTNEDVIDEKTIIALYDNLLVAELIIDDSTTVDCFGAYGDDTHDDISYINSMISKCGYLKTSNKTYLTSETINLSFDCEINGKIHYNGNDYAFTINSCNHKKISINNIESSGGGILLEPQTNQFISFIDLYLKYAICTNETIKCDATNGAITLINLNGIRWRSSANGLVLLNINSTHAANTFLTEINLHNIDLWTQNSLKAIVATNSASDVEIQFNLYNCNLENSKGISTTGKISMLGLYDCRMPEIVNVNGWLTFNNYLPQVTLQGNGYLYPQNIVMNGITNAATGSNNYIETNMTIIDATSTYNYEGGGVLYYNYFAPKIKKQVWKDLSSDISNHYVTYSINKNGAIYNYFTITSDSWVQLTIPTQKYLPECLIRVTNSISLTITNGSGTKTIESAEGLYHICQAGNGIWYSKLG